MHKKLFVALAASTITVSTTLSYAQTTPVEPDAVMSDGVTRAQTDALAGLIRLNGYSCNSISAVVRFVFSYGFTVTCNSYRYTYEVEDRGGNWTVTVK